MMRIVWLAALLCCSGAFADTVQGIKVNAIAQTLDDEESPFEFQASNKQHTCGGKNSAWFRVYAGHEKTAMQRFALVQQALEKDMHLTVVTNGCEGRYLKVEAVVLSR